MIHLLLDSSASAGMRPTPVIGPGTLGTAYEKSALHLAAQEGRDRSLAAYAPRGSNHLKQQRPPRHLPDISPQAPINLLFISP